MFSICKSESESLTIIIIITIIILCEVHELSDNLAGK